MLNLLFHDGNHQGQNSKFFMFVYNFLLSLTQQTVLQYQQKQSSMIAFIFKNDLNNYFLRLNKCHSEILF